ncbi:unnamed protein product [Clonostachys solani]|uniref:CHAT domain-containing protein n=1 Tax=Clonostachys solani TaxID=160281 RepID=A0A9P0EJR4_9HYPO|nr:unnamed protein product [Clonostachys solani]
MIGLGILQADNKLWPIEDLAEWAEENTPRYYLGIPTPNGSLSTISRYQYLELLPQAIENTPESDAAGRLEFLATLCRAYPEEDGESIMTKEASSLIAYVEQAIAWTGESHQLYPELLVMLTTLLACRFGYSSVTAANVKASATAANVEKARQLKLKALPDIEEALGCREKALALTSKDDAKWIPRLNGITDLLLIKAQTTQVGEDLQAVEGNARKVADMVPEGHPQKTTVLWKLGDVLDHLSEMDTSSESYFEESMQFRLRALSLVKYNGARKPAWEGHVQYRLITRYQSTGRIAYLDEAISFAQGCIADDSSEAGPLYEIGELFMTRYLRTGAMSDLDESIRRMELAVQRGEDLDATLTEWVNSLAAGYGYRYSITRVESDIKRSIHLLRDMQKRISWRQSARYEFDECWQNQVECAIHLATQLESRFQVSKSMRDLDEAIELDKNVIHQVGLRQFGSMHNKQRVFTQYAIRLLKRYRIQKSAADLANAGIICYQAVNEEPDGVNLSFALCTLGDVIYQQHIDGTSPDALSTASLTYKDGFSQENASPQHRIQCGMGLLKTLCLMKRWEDGYEASNKTLTLVQQMMARSLENAEKQYLLGQCVGFASDAASVALNAGKGPEIALQFLEQGRGLLASSIEDSRIDVTSLQTSYPDLAEKFISIRERLQESATPRIDPKTRHDFKNHEEARSVQRHKLGEDLDRLVDEIRTRPGFETFLAAPTVPEMQAAAVDGAIVVLNVSNYRSDAIVVQKDRVHAVALPMLSKEEVVERARGGTTALASTETLEWLWETIASPILDCLGFTHALGQDESQWPRIWWVATGIMSSFPIHAAGWHAASPDLGHTVLDRVVSSYSSSIKAIIYSQRRPAFDYEKLRDQSQALLVAVPQAPGCSSLPSAAKEHLVLQKLFNTISWKVHAAENTKNGVMSRLRSSQVFHFAGHGTVDPLNPSRSFLFLEDWKKDPFTVAELLELNLQQGMPFLAYLSACRTGQIRDEESLDESVHLISAFQLAGFRHVIGTLWEVNDDICVDMANYAYQAMWNGRFTDRSVCLGLHTAMRKLRDEWRSRLASSGQRRGIRAKSKFVHSAGSQMNRSQSSKEGRDMVSCDEEEKLFWVPFVHFGV